MPKHITAYLNEIEEKGFDNNLTVKTLVENLRAIKTLCDNYHFNPTRRHGEAVISEISDWMVE